MNHCAPPPFPELGPSVHVWFTRIDQDQHDQQRLARLLSDDEQARADRFRAQSARTQFVLARGLLRAILGCYLGRPGEEIRFAYGPQGKPSLGSKHAGGGLDLHFNLTHSRDLLLIALAAGREVGVDAEHLSAEVDTAEIAERFFSPSERAAIQALPEPQRRRAFFTCWTRKEAYLKARGIGLSEPLRSFTVSVAPHEPPALVATPDDPSQAARWSIADLAIAPDYAAALAVEGPLEGIRQFRATPATLEAGRRAG